MKAILLDASSSYLPSAGSTYYYKFEIGTDIIETSNPRVYTTLTSGTYDVYLSVNDQPFISSGSSSYGVTVGGTFLNTKYRISCSHHEYQAAS